MKAAVLHAYGVPEFGEFADPVAESGLQIVDVRAATVNAVDVSSAAGTHYLSPKQFPVVPGVEGVGTLPDGRRVYFGRPVLPYGSMAERTLAPDHFTIDLPDGIDDAVAAAVGNAGMAALMPLSWRGALQPGEAVLVLGATGVVGRLAVQAAKLLGAGIVVAAGRDAEALEEVKGLGADAIVQLDSDDPADAFRAAADGSVDVIIDYTWGAPAEAALRASSRNARLVQVGDRAGTDITLNAQLLRSTGTAVFGFMPLHAGPAAMRTAYAQLVEWAISGDLRVEVEILPLRAVAEAWTRTRTARHKLVLQP
jgi:NADPH:quinone reductase-like Zn-dependent oxidoreductase